MPGASGAWNKCWLFFLPRIRTIFCCSGRKIISRVFGRHEDSIINGRGENPAVIKRDYELMKWVNANSFRTSHYPYSEENLRMADREGFLVIDECAAVGFMSSLKNLVKRISRGSF